MKSMKLHVGIFGKTNVGKSSFLNSLSYQEVSIVSDRPGTTTDPVTKAIELTDIGAVYFIDTPGLDDLTTLGEKRVAAAIGSLDKIDQAVLVIANNSFDEVEIKLIEKLNKKEIPFLIVHNKSDSTKLSNETKNSVKKYSDLPILEYSATTSPDRDLIVKNLAKLKRPFPQMESIIGDLVKPGDVVLLVTPIDEEAPAGRMILPQVQVLRDALDNHCIVVSVRETELLTFMSRKMIKPDLVITDSQVFGFVSKIIPEDIPLTSFSILFARLKGDFNEFRKGVDAIKNLKDGDRILIQESCSHHIAGDDIGRVKLPKWIKEQSGKEINFDIVAGFNSPPKKPQEYALVIQCGGCMFTKAQVLKRIEWAKELNIPVTNYGMAIGHCHGIYERAVRPFI